MPRRSVQALVMQIKDYRESSAMVRFFSREEGPLTGVIKGYKRRRRSLRLAPFQRGGLVISGGSGLATVSSFDAEQEYAFTGDGLAAAFYVYELVSRGVAEYQAEPELYDATAATLAAIARAEPLSAWLREFEFRLLEVLGFGIDLASTAKGEPISAEASYRFVMDTGLELCDASSADALPGAALQQIAQRDYGRASVQRTARQLTRVALRPIVGDKPLVSRHMLSAGSRALADASSKN